MFIIIVLKQLYISYKCTIIRNLSVTVYSTHATKTLIFSYNRTIDGNHLWHTKIVFELLVTSVL